MPPYGAINWTYPQLGKGTRSEKNYGIIWEFFPLGPGRPSAGGPRWDRRLNTLTHASLRACGAKLGGSVWKQGK